MSENLPKSILIFAIGLFCLLSSLKNWDFFFNNYKMRFLISIFGRRGVRIFYAILGTALSISGIIFLFTN
jgi:hypothetical protein